MFQHVESKFHDTNAIWVFRSFQYGRHFAASSQKDNFIEKLEIVDL